MARLVFGMNVSLDGFVDHDHPDLAPDPELFRHFVAEAAAQAGSLYGSAQAPWFADDLV